MIVVGLTGSIAMGKTETARMFQALGVPVFDSDAEVHRLYGVGGELVGPVSNRFPATLVAGAIDRAILSSAVLNDRQALADLEAIVHPMIRRQQDEFLSLQRTSGQGIAVLDIPLLFETGRNKDVDVVVVVTAPLALQRDRALARPGMTPDKLDAIMAKQWPDDRKRACADFIVETSRGLDDARRQVKAIVDTLMARKEDADDA